MKHLKIKIAMCVFALCAAVAVVTFSSCSNDEPIQTEISGSAVTSSELVASIVSFNDSLSSCVSQTRSWDGFLRVVGIASADIVGAYELGKIGAGVGSFFCTWSWYCNRRCHRWCVRWSRCIVSCRGTNACLYLTSV